MIQERFELNYYILCLMHITSIITGMVCTERLIYLNIYVFTDLHVYLTGGILFIPVIFFIQDIVTEIYGYEKAKNMIFINIIIFIMFAIFMKISSIIDIHFSQNVPDFSIVSNSLPRQTIAFTISFLIGSLLNNYILSNLKRLLSGRFMALRFITSTAIGDLFFQIIAVSIAWYGVVHDFNIIQIAILSYFYKVIFEILVTPANIYICNKLRPEEI